MAIHNDDKVGNYYVRVLAVKKPVASFQTRDLVNAKAEAAKVRQQRDKDGLPTGRIYAREIVSSTCKGRRALLLSDTEHEL